MIKNADAYGAELWDYYITKKDNREIVERDNNFVDGDRKGYGGSVYFAEYKNWSPIEKKAIAYARGRVLDVGCGAGRHALYLQKKGLDVTGIDVSPLAVKICRLRGLRKTQVLSFERIDKFPVNSFDTVMMMGNNFGLFSSFRKAKILLRKLFRIMSPDALIIAVTTDPYQTKNPTHQRYQRLNRSRGRMPGQLRIRIRHATVIGPWFDYLLVSTREVKQIINGTGWRIKKFIDSKGPRYAMILEKAL
jgi:SAM-dependent methyltransferase